MCAIEVFKYLNGFVPHVKRVQHCKGTQGNDHSLSSVVGRKTFAFLSAKVLKKTSKQSEN